MRYETPRQRISRETAHDNCPARWLGDRSACPNGLAAVGPQAHSLGSTRDAARLGNRTCLELSPISPQPMDQLQGRPDRAYSPQRAFPDDRHSPARFEQLGPIPTITVDVGKDYNLLDLSI